ncbi:MAG TPA: hypothetical protein VH234_04610 [Candidatus Saccharimonadales bacterium]|jgi:hypothetical protein|nr:hypothetical protein [Candidatus Saccharimonadales bacterium]
MIKATGSLEANSGHEQSLVESRVQRFSHALTQEPLENLLPWGYEIARELGDRAFVTHPENPSIQPLLDTSYGQAFPKHFYLYDDDTPGASGAEHWESGRELGINSHHLGRYTPRRGGAKNSQDARLIEVMSRIGHESGHALLGGVSRHLKPYDLDGLYATRKYLASHPELGLTSHWSTDYSIHEERFAEGYERLVRGELLRALGYSVRRQRAIMSRWRHSFDAGGSEGENQIDYLRHADGQNGPPDMVIGHRPQQDNKGQLGYPKPLSLKQIGDQLSELSKFQDSPLEADDLILPAHWEQQVRRQRSTHLRLYMGRMKLARWNSLNPVKSRALKAGGVAVYMAILYFGEGGLLNEVWPPSEAENAPALIYGHKARPLEEGHVPRPSLHNVPNTIRRHRRHVQ